MGTIEIGSRQNLIYLEISKDVRHEGTVIIARCIVVNYNNERR